MNWIKNIGAKAVVSAFNQIWLSGSDGELDENLSCESDPLVSIPL